MFGSVDLHCGLQSRSVGVYQIRHVHEDIYKYYVFSLLGPWLEFSLTGHIVVFFGIFHVVHVSLPFTTSGFWFYEHVV